MAKEILLYFGIYSFTAEDVIKSLNDALGEEVVLRVNSSGGDVFSTWGISSKISEHGNVTVKVDGMAASSAANLLLYAKRVEALDVSNFVLHRADAYVSDAQGQDFLNKVNKDLRKKMEARIDETRLKELKGVTFDQIFNPEQRIDVFLTAKEALAIGLISKVNKLAPTELEAVWKDFRIAASIPSSPAPAIPSPTISTTQTSKTMTVAELKAQFPQVYADIFNAGAAAEKDRVEACMVFADYDLPSVKEAIASGKPLSQKQMAELNLKVLAKGAITKIGEQNPPTVATTEVQPPVARTEKEKTVEGFAAGVKAALTSQAPHDPSTGKVVKMGDNAFHKVEA